MHTLHTTLNTSLHRTHTPNEDYLRQSNRLTPSRPLPPMYRVENMTSPLLSSFLSSPLPLPLLVIQPPTILLDSRNNNKNNTSDINPVVSNSIPSAFPPTTKNPQNSVSDDDKIKLSTTKKTQKAAQREIPLLSQLCPNPALPTSYS